MTGELHALFPDINFGDPDYIDLLRSVSVTTPTLIFAMTARVGSTALMSIFKKIDAIGDMTEIFNARGVANMHSARLKADSFIDYIDKLKRSRKSAIFGFKVAWQDFEFLVPNEMYKILFPNAKFVFLDRIDLEAQAVSVYAARATGLWHRKSGTQVELPASVEFDVARINARAAELLKHKLNWCAFFQKHNILPLTIIYEIIRDNPISAVEAICAYVDVVPEKRLNWDDSEIVRLDVPAFAELLRKYRLAKALSSS
jgi:LPS sulfotransferase NodH